MYMNHERNLDVLHGLSDQPPPVIEEYIKEVTLTMKTAFCITVIAGNGSISLRVLKYVARRLVTELKIFNDLVWVVIGHREVCSLSMKDFQLQIARTLGILHSRTGDGGEEDTDEVLSSKIHEHLKNRSFLLVQNGGWSLDQLGRMGIPNNFRGDNFLVLAPWVEIAGYNIVEIDKIKLSVWFDREKVGDLLKEVSLDIADSPKFQGNISADVVLEVIIYSILLYSEIENLQMFLLVFYAEGFIGHPDMDLGEILRFGESLLDELRLRDIVSYDDGKFRTRITRREAKEIAEKKLGRHFHYASPSFEQEDLHRIGLFNISDESPLEGTNFTSLVTLFIYESLSLKIPQNAFENMKCLQVLSISGSRISSFPSSLACLGKSLKFFGLSKCVTPKSLQLSWLLKGLGKLEILDLSRTGWEQIPDNTFEDLQSLRLLDMSECPSEFSLPSSISCLLNLEQLKLRNCKYLSLLPASLQPLKKLQLLDLSGTKVEEIPDNFFHQNMVNLKDVDLSSNDLLTSLPSSIFNLINLKKLQLNHCWRLQNIIRTTPRRVLSALEELNLRGCESLQDIDHVSSTFWDMIPNLKSLDLSETPIVSLISVNKLLSLENITLESNEKLCRVDLSGINIKKFCLHKAPLLEGLAGLDMKEAEYIHKVFWRSVTGGQAEFNLDLLLNDDMSHIYILLAEWRRNGNGSGIFISVENGNIFRHLREDHSWLRDHFLVYVCPRIRLGSRKTLPIQRAARRYKDIYSKKNPPMFTYEKYLEIEQVKNFPNHISVVLSQTQSLYVHDEGTIARLSDLGIENMNELKQCSIKRCQSMTVIFGIRSLAEGQTGLPILRNLEMLQISNLLKLTEVCINTNVLLTHGSFGNLKHMCLEYCPRVVTGFTSGVCLESLETLEIRFCLRLKEIFAGKVNGKGALDRLHTIFLFELPVLESIAHNVQLASLRNAHVKGCPKLQKIPFHRTACGNSSDIAQAVVTGESEWWQKLEWNNDIVKQHIHFNPWNRYRKWK